MDSLIFSVDFDGTCVTASFPKVGYNIGAAPVLKALVDKGHKIILFTVRDYGNEDWQGRKIETGDFLLEAVDWFSSNGITLFGINKNPEQTWSNSPKAFADIIIDDYALGCPLKTIKDETFVDWVKVVEFLTNKGIFTPLEAYSLNAQIQKELYTLVDILCV